jgi:DNA-binding transcriptional LysR family regulator
MYRCRHTTTGFRIWGLRDDFKIKNSSLLNTRQLLRVAGAKKIKQGFEGLLTAEAGEAMAVLPRVLADRRPALMRIEPPLPEPSNTVKLGVHPDMRDTPRVRALIDFLVAELKARSRELNPRRAGSALRSGSPWR